MDHLLHHLLQRSAERHADRGAVVDGPRTLSYGELERWADQVAHLLIDLGVERGERVGLYLDKSIEAVVAIYGTLKAGAVYVPFDPSAPAKRLAYIAADCGVEVLLTGAEKQGRWQALLDGGAPLRSLVVLNRREGELEQRPRGVRCLGAEAVDARPDEPPAVAAIGADLAYILYTSGSTGDPKGVMLTHRNALAFVEWATEEFGVGPDDRLSSHAPFHFDLSVFDLFAAARAGAAVVLVPPKLSAFPGQVARFMADYGITVWYSVPSLLTMLAQRGGLERTRLPRLRAVLFAGEVFPTKYLRGLMRLLPHARFANLYGPTETNVCTWYDVPPLPDEMTETIPIGTAIADVEVAVVGDDGALVSPGEVGELWVRGSTVMRGYWGDAERTARALTSRPVAGGIHDLLYRTGDLVREDRHGELRLVGRLDAQIKSRGYRIELGEIETALYAHPEVDECAVIAVPDELVTNRITAYVVARDGVSRKELVAFCADRIPRYMVPDTFVFADRLAKTSTGKIDRQALEQRSTTSDDRSTTS